MRADEVANEYQACLERLKAASRSADQLLEQACECSDPEESDKLISEAALLEKEANELAGRACDLFDQDQQNRIRFF